MLASLAAAALVIPVSAWCGSSPLRPVACGIGVSFGWDDNLLQSSKAEKDAFEHSSPEALFVIDRLSDWAGRAEAWGRWELPSVYRKLRVEFSYERAQWARTAILGSDRYELDLRQKLPDGSTVDGTLAYVPQTYLRHRVDKKAVAGEPRFRPESFRGYDAELSYQRPLRGALRVQGTLSYEVEDRNHWFDDRDESTTGGELALRIPMGTRLTASPGYGYTKTDGRNDPSIGPDRSHRQHVGSLRLQAASFSGDGPHWVLEGGGKWKFRSYTTPDRQDASRFDRNDLLYSWNVRLARPGNGGITPYVTVEGAGRAVDLPSGADASDEEGEYTDLMIRLGLEWEMENP